MIFYLKAHRPQYRDRLNIDVKQLTSEIEERMAQLREGGIDFRRMKSFYDRSSRARVYFFEFVAARLRQHARWALRPDTRRETIYEFGLAELK